jgi:esterase FrsA
VTTVTREHDASYLDELKQLVLLHARSQGLSIPHCQTILGAIRSDGGDTPDSWVAVWCAKAEACLARGDQLGACRHFNMARFPYLDGIARESAHHRCVVAFQSWASERNVKRVDIALDDGHVGVWLDAETPKHWPLLLVMGGIVSIKEQWGQMIPLARRLRMCIAVTEMPGVGDNTLRYQPDSWRMVTALLNRLADDCDVGQTYMLALSFSGHLALQASLRDSRLRGVLTVGAPVHAFFSEQSHWRHLPETTLRTLAHVTGFAKGRLPSFMKDFSLTADELARIDIPVSYVASRKDEIIPSSEYRMLRDYAPRWRLIEHDDVHGSPHHLLATRLFLIHSLLDMRGGSIIKRRLLGFARWLLRIRDTMRKGFA